MIPGLGNDTGWRDKPVPKFPPELWGAATTQGRTFIFYPYLLTSSRESTRVGTALHTGTHFSGGQPSPCGIGGEASYPSRSCDSFLNQADRVEGKINALWTQRTHRKNPSHPQAFNTGWKNLITKQSKQTTVQMIYSLAMKLTRGLSRFLHLKTLSQFSWGRAWFQASCQTSKEAYFMFSDCLVYAQKCVKSFSMLKTLLPFFPSKHLHSSSSNI